MRGIGVLLLAAGLAACSAGGGGPEAGFERVKVAVATRDPRLLYDALDTESRWAVDTVWKYQREIGALVETFPPEVRARQMARVEAARAARTSRDFFAAWAVDPFARLGGGREGLGERARVEKAGQEATVVTTTGLAIPLAVDKEGKWGWAGLRKELVEWRHHTANDLGRLQEDAALYRRGP